MKEVTYEDAETLRVRLNLTKRGFRKYLGVSEKRYWLWKNNGVAIESQRLLRVFIEEPGKVIEILSKD